jgi:hypothetical protein
MTRKAKVYDLATVRAKLTEFVAAHGYKTAAEKCGVTPDYLRHVLHPVLKKHPGPKVLAALGLERVYAEVAHER